jgi:hypothetical protein
MICCFSLIRSGLARVDALRAPSKISDKDQELRSSIALAAGASGGDREWANWASRYFPKIQKATQMLKGASSQSWLVVQVEFRASFPLVSQQALPPSSSWALLSSQFA